MAELPTAAEVAGLASLLAPGLIILGLKARFQNGSVPDLKEQIISYAVASAAYYAAASPLFHVRHGASVEPWLWHFLQYFIFPSVVGLVIVWFDQTEWFYQLCAKAGLRLTHHVPAAWDYAFSRIIKGTFVLVKLNDGTLYAGKMANRSFASSSTAERDLFLEEVWDADTKPWSPVIPKRGVLLCGKDVKWVEIFERT